MHFWVHHNWSRCRHRGGQGHGVLHFFRLPPGDFNQGPGPHRTGDGDHPGPERGHVLHRANSGHSEPDHPDLRWARRRLRHCDCLCGHACHAGHHACQRRLRAGGRQRGRPRGAGQPRRRGAQEDGFPGRPGQHDGRCGQRLCDRLRRAHVALAPCGLQRPRGPGRGCLRRVRPRGVGGRVAGGHAALPLRSPYHAVSGQGCRRHHAGGSPPVQ
mmetsp:Transcript_70346/g.227760  ORF Transcript_70346/g.227760 Transcript_70346/m.227760 type:complete len:214 (-) Transcript_70346:1138-1779(-)